MENSNREVGGITSGTAGIGRATIEEFARHGAAIAIMARDPERLEAARTEAELLAGGAAIGAPGIFFGWRKART